MLLKQSPSDEMYFSRVWPLLLQAEAEIQEDAVAPRQKIVLIDDLLATGGEGSPDWRRFGTILFFRFSLTGEHLSQKE